MRQDWPRCVSCGTDFHPADVDDDCPDCGNPLRRPLPRPTTIPVAVVSAQILLLVPPTALVVAVATLGGNPAEQLVLPVALTLVTLGLVFGLALRKGVARQLAVLAAWGWLTVGVGVTVVGLLFVVVWFLGCFVMPFGVALFLIGLVAIRAAASPPARAWCRRADPNDESEGE